MIEVARRFPPVYQQFIKYAIVGVANVALHLGVFNLARLAGAGPVVSNVVGFGVASIQSFTLNRKWSFRDTSQRHHLRVYPVFLLFTLIGLGIHTLLFRFIAGYTHEWGRLGENIALLAAVPASVAWNFFAYRRWTFTPPDRASRPDR